MGRKMLLILLTPPTIVDMFLILAPHTIRIHPTRVDLITISRQFSLMRFFINSCLYFPRDLWWFADYNVNILRSYFSYFYKNLSHLSWLNLTANWNFQARWNLSQFVDGLQSINNDYANLICIIAKLTNRFTSSKRFDE